MALIVPQPKPVPANIADCISDLLAPPQPSPAHNQFVSMGGRAKYLREVVNIDVENNTFEIYWHTAKGKKYHVLIDQDLYTIYRDRYLSLMMPYKHQPTMYEQDEWPDGPLGTLFDPLLPTLFKALGYY